jgi:hypothetical protein
MEFGFLIGILDIIELHPQSWANCKVGLVAILSRNSSPRIIPMVLNPFSFLQTHRGNMI